MTENKTSSQPSENSTAQPTKEPWHRSLRDKVSDKYGVLKEKTVNFLKSARENVSKAFSSASESIRKRTSNLSFREKREQIESGEDLKNFLSEIMGQKTDKPPRGGIQGVPPSLALGVGIGAGLARSQLLAVGLEAGVAAPGVSAFATLARDTVTILSNKDDVVAALNARYVREKPGTARTTRGGGKVKEKGKLAKAKDKVLHVSAKAGWGLQAVERTLVGKITETKLAEGSRNKKLLNFINNKLGEIKEENGNIEEYLTDPEKLWSDVKEWLASEKESDKTGYLIETFGLLSDSRRKDAHRSLGKNDNLDNIIGENNEGFNNLEKLRESLHEVILSNLYAIRNLNKNKFNDYIDQLSRYKWSKGKTFKYVAAIGAVGMGTSALKSLVGVKIGELISELPEVFSQIKESEFGEMVASTYKDAKKAVGESAEVASERLGEIVDQAGKTLQDINQEAGQLAGDFNRSVGDAVDKITGQDGGGVVHQVSGADANIHEVSQFSPDIEQLREQMQRAGDAARNFFDNFKNAGEAPWDTGAQAGEHLSSRIDMGGLNESWMHGSIKVPRSEAFKNFFGHWVTDGGPTSEDVALEMANNLRDALLLDQEDFMKMAHLIREVQDAANASELTEILSSMPKEDAVNVAYFSYAEGLPFAKNPEIRQVIVDFIKSNTG